MSLCSHVIHVIMSSLEKCTHIQQTFEWKLSIGSKLGNDSETLKSMGKALDLTIHYHSATLLVCGCSYSPGRARVCSVLPCSSAGVCCIFVAPGWTDLSPQGPFAPAVANEHTYNLMHIYASVQSCS